MLKDHYDGWFVDPRIDRLQKIFQIRFELFAAHIDRHDVECSIRHEKGMNVGEDRIGDQIPEREIDCTIFTYFQCHFFYFHIIFIFSQ